MRLSRRHRVNAHERGFVSCHLEDYAGAQLWPDADLESAVRVRGRADVRAHARAALDRDVDANKGAPCRVRDRLLP